MPDLLLALQNMQQAYAAPSYRTIVLNTLLAHIEAPANSPSRVPNALFITGPVTFIDEHEFTVPGIGARGAGVSATFRSRQKPSRVDGFELSSPWKPNWVSDAETRHNEE